MENQYFINKSLSGELKSLRTSFLWRATHCAKLWVWLTDLYRAMWSSIKPVAHPHLVKTENKMRYKENKPQHPQTLDPSQYLLMQVMQKLWPHGVEEGFVNTSRHMEHMNCSSDRKLPFKDILEQKTKTTTLLSQHYELFAVIGILYSHREKNRLNVVWVGGSLSTDILI